MVKAIRFGEVKSDFWGYAVYDPSSTRIPDTLFTIKKEKYHYVLIQDSAGCGKSYVHHSDPTNADLEAHERLNATLVKTLEEL